MKLVEKYAILSELERETKCTFSCIFLFLCANDIKPIDNDNKPNPLLFSLFPILAMYCSSKPVFSSKPIAPSKNIGICVQRFARTFFL